MYAKQHEGEFPAERPAESPLEQKLKKQHEINRYLIPLSLLIAIITELSLITTIAWALLIFYFAYYIKVYYLDR